MSKPSSADTGAAKPLLKWAGGKSWAVQHLGPAFLEHLTENGGHYVEPFLGSAAMAIYLSWPTAILGDAIEDLVHLYRFVRDEPEAIIEAVEEYKLCGTDKAAYNEARAERPDDPLYMAARFLYLNRLSFNGVWRVNKKGGMNMPYGDGKFTFPERERFEALSVSLRGATLLCDDFAETISFASQDGSPSLVYADPPYHGVYDSYTAQRFGDDDQERLAEALWYAHERGAQIVVHNAYTNLIRYLYGDWMEIVPIDERRPVAAVGTARQAASCMVAATDPRLLREFTST